MHFMVLLSCHNLHVVVLVVTIHSNKQPHIIAHCETNYATKQNVRKQNSCLQIFYIVDCLSVESVVYVCWCCIIIQHQQALKVFCRTQ